MWITTPIYLGDSILSTSYQRSHQRKNPSKSGFFILSGIVPSLLVGRDDVADPESPSYQGFLAE